MSKAMGGAMAKAMGVTATAASTSAASTAPAFPLVTTNVAPLIDWNVSQITALPLDNDRFTDSDYDLTLGAGTQTWTSNGDCDYITGDGRLDLAANPPPIENLHRAGSANTITYVGKTPSSLGAYRWILDTSIGGGGGADTGVQLVINGSGKLQFYIQNAGTSQTNAATDAAVSAATNYIMTLSYDPVAGSGFFMLNGTIWQVSGADTFTVTATSSAAPQNVLHVNDHTSQPSFTADSGRFYRLLIHNVALTQDASVSLYNGLVAQMTDETFA